jgi:glycosyltransferase involved in cell wall biosynthesis
LIPFFSILIPTYNRSQLLIEAVQSALAQSFEDFEVIVVDDGGTDNTENVIGSFNSPKVSYFKTENKERGAARNFGISKAKGEYLVFMDSDDVMLPNHLETLHSHLKDHPEDLIATKYFFFAEKKGSAVPADVKRLASGYHDYKSFLIGNPLACCFTIRRRNVSLVKFREELKYVIMEDWIFLIENLIHSKLYLMPYVTMGMRDHDSRSMRGNAQKIIDARNNALVYLLNNIELKHDDLRILKGSSAYFCAVHAYIGVNPRLANRYLMQSILTTGISKKAILLAIKIVAQRLTVWQGRES